MRTVTFTFSPPSPLRLLPRASAARQISTPANSFSENFKSRSSKVSLDPTCLRLTGKSSPSPIRGLAGDLRVESGSSFLAGVTGNRHAIAAGSMSTSSPRFTDSSPNNPQPNSTEPTFIEALDFLPPNISDIRLAQPFSASSSNILGRIPTVEEIQAEIEGQARMAAKVPEVEQKKGSKSRNREGEKGQWWPCEVTDSELKAFAKEGFIAPDTWSFQKESSTPNPEPEERVFTKAWVERDLSLPPPEFFLSVLSTYGLQPHNIYPNSFILLSNFVTLYEGHLGIRPDIRLWQFFYRVKKETKDKVMVNCGSMTFVLRAQRIYSDLAHESVRYWNAGWFCVKNVPVPGVHNGLPAFINNPSEELASWCFIPSIRNWTRLLGGSLASGEASAKKAKTKPPPRLDSKKAERECIKQLATAGEGSRPLLPGATSQKVTTSRANTQKPITNYLKMSPAIGPTTPAPPSTSNTAPKPTPPEAQPSPDPAANAQVEIIPVSSEKGGGSCSAAKRNAPEEPQGQGLEEAEAYSHKFFNKLTEMEKWELKQDLLNSMLNNAWGKADIESPKIQNHKKEISEFLDQLLIKRKEQQALHYELHKNIALQRRLTLSQADKIHDAKERIAELEKLLAEAQELEAMRSAHKDLESKLKEVEKGRKDSDTLTKLQEDVQHLLTYMRTSEQGWDLLNAGIMEPLGYDEAKHEMFPCDDLIQLAGDDCKDLISVSREICHNLAIKDCRTCDVRDLIRRIDLLPELVVDLQASSPRGATQMSLAMFLARALTLNIDVATAGIPLDADADALLDACSGYDTRIARRIRHEEFYDKVMLPADEAL
ncbi:hypothetical protein QYE76_050764 [Lolium multiflorum]|uniref:Transposase (putative) gypsy type domain-containing protein n=1 Tax=Lolium multiflorum TaxID=4521 RepID=A0AAD8WJX5_LOLMU|nr:hypothetical protein QYE76_050764 [Lolium multiflorum]